MDLLTLQVLAVENPSGCVDRAPPYQRYYHAQCLADKTRNHAFESRDIETAQKAEAERSPRSYCMHCGHREFTPWTP